MRHTLLACVLALLSSAAMAQTTIDGLPPVPVFPLPDPATTPSNVWITQGGGDFKISPYRLASPFQGATPPANPFPQQLWWRTTPGQPAQLLSWNGTNWMPFSSGLLNVTGLGVAGDGTDVSTALQTAVNANIGACLYFPTPSVGYALGSRVTLPHGACLIGDSGGSRIFSLPANHTGLFIAAVNSVTRLTDIRLDGNRSNGATGDCLATDPSVGVQGMELDRVTTTACSGSGMFFGGSATPSTNVQVHNSFLTGNGVGLNAQYVTNFNFETSLMQDNDGPGIACATGANGAGYCRAGTIAGNVLIHNGCSNGSDNISGQSEQISDVSIVNNVSQTSCGEGIQFGGSRARILGNSLIGNAQNGIFVQSVRKYSTGTISVNNGSTAVTGVGTGWSGLCPDIQLGFISNTGTRLQTAQPPGNAVTGGGSVAGVQIKSIDSNTSMTLSVPWSGSTLLNATYTIRCPVAVVSPIISSNAVQGIPAGWNGIFLAKPSGGTITGNSVDDASGLHGILLTGDSAGNGATISANTVASKTNSGIRIDSDGRYGTGTVTATTGSPTVTLAGGSFDQIPNVTWFRATGDLVAYQVSAQTATTLTLTTNYSGTTGSGKAYIAQSGMSTGTNISGNTSRLNDVGINLAGCWACAVAGGTNNSNTTASVLESGASSHNIMTGFSGATVTVVDATTQYLATGNASSLKLGNLPTTPSGKQPVCVDVTTGVLYKGNAGAC